MQVIDSHTGGEPTRVVVSGGPDLGVGPLSERASRFSAEFDHYRAAIVNEPRGSDVIVGALLCDPYEPDCDAGVIFFNNVGMLGMCGHGTIGLAATLHWLGRADLGSLRVDTPVGVVGATLLDPHRVQIDNVPSRRYRRGVRLETSDWGEVVGDVAWGGNWFFLTESIERPLHLGEAETLKACGIEIRRQLMRQGVTGAGGAEIDHIELLGPPADGGDGRSFVLCPGAAYDRSPCGTGVSAKLACLAADQKLAPGTSWCQESVIGSVFLGEYQLLGADSAKSAEGQAWPTGAWEAGEGVDHEAPWVKPRITGAAYVTAQSTLVLDPADPFCWGLKAADGPTAVEAGVDE